MMSVTAQRTKHFWVNVRKTKTCWFWTGTTSPQGYGYIFEWHHGPVRLSASRYSFMLHYPHLDARGLMVCHHCDEPSCVKPTHLFLGTAQENRDDYKSKAALRLAELWTMIDHRHRVIAGECSFCGEPCQADLSICTHCYWTPELCKFFDAQPSARTNEGLSVDRRTASK